MEPVEGRFQIRITPKTSDLGLCFLTNTLKSNNKKDKQNNILFHGFDFPQPLILTNPKKDSKFTSQKTPPTFLSPSYIPALTPQVLATEYLSQDYFDPSLLQESIQSLTVGSNVSTAKSPTPATSTNQPSVSIGNNAGLIPAPSNIYSMVGSLTHYKPNSVLENSNENTNEGKKNDKITNLKYIFELDIYSVLRLITLLSKSTSSTQSVLLNPIVEQSQTPTVEAVFMENITIGRNEKESVNYHLKKTEFLPLFPQQELPIEESELTFRNTTSVPLCSSTLNQDSSTASKLTTALYTHPILSQDPLALSIICMVFSQLFSVSKQHQTYISQLIDQNGSNEESFTQQRQWFETYHAMYLKTLAQCITRVGDYFRYNSVTDPQLLSPQTAFNNLDSLKTRDQLDNNDSLLRNIPLEQIKEFLEFVNRDLSLA
jgi:hypothetical protein